MVRLGWIQTEPLLIAIPKGLPKQGALTIPRRKNKQSYTRIFMGIEVLASSTPSFLLWCCEVKPMETIIREQNQTLHTLKCEAYVPKIL